MVNDKELLKSIGNLSVTAEDGKDIELSALWESRRTALVFIRHFG